MVKAYHIAFLRPQPAPTSLPPLFRPPHAESSPKVLPLLWHRGHFYVYMGMMGASNVELVHKIAFTFPHMCLGKAEAAMGSVERKYVRESAEQGSRGTHLHRPPARLTFPRGFRTIQATTVDKRLF